MRTHCIHSRGNHWVVASTIHARDGVVQVNDGTRSIINNLFPPSSSLELIKIQKQIGGKGVWAFFLCNFNGTSIQTSSRNNEF